MASNEIDVNKLSALIIQKRNDRPLRVVAEEIRTVSAPTLSRVEKGNLPDLETFARLCKWLNVSPDEFVIDAPTPQSGPELEPSDEACAALRADRNLPSSTKNAIIELIKVAQRDAKSGKLD